MCHIVSIDDTEIYFYLVGGRNKTKNVYGLGVLSKRFTSSKSIDSTTNQPLLVHQIEKMREIIEKLNVELMAKNVKEQTLEEKMDQLITDHGQMKPVFQHIQVDNLMPSPSNRTPDEHHRQNHTTI